MFQFLSQIFDENKKLLDRYSKQVDQINALESTIAKLSDAKLAAQTTKLKKLITEARQQGKSDGDILTDLLPEAFATMREAAKRIIGLRHFDVQLLAGIALHYGAITEQKTGEGKTLTVTLPLYLNALLGRGAHLVTVNDYLAEVGAGWMGPVYQFLGLTTAVLVHDKAKKYDSAVDSEERGDERLEHFVDIERKEAYLCDITYGTNHEFGFDYLRDNMVPELTHMVQRQDSPHYFAIVDEADSILIDEARTPLIISAPDSEPTKQYYDYAQMVTSLAKDSDYAMDEKSRTATLTDLGVKRIEQKLGVKNLYEESFDIIHHIENALKARVIFTRDKDYIVREGEVIIVDEHTGRLMFGRRYSDGLHQAIEAKENVKIQQESRTLATISIQNYFRQYEKLSGMTGTAATEAEEFEKIYQTTVVVVPTNVPAVRQDKIDVVYKTAGAKFTAIAAQVEEIHKTGQPILIGTRSIKNNQIVSDFLTRKKITHQVLNAKNHEKEAFIISDAGRQNAITVATNIAGRGVDIVLGGAKPELKDYRKEKRNKNDKPTAKQTELAKKLKLPASLNPAHYKLAEYDKSLTKWQSDHDSVVKLGGLFIIGTERHESRRIDNQLRGRAGRQGDPGASQFFVALEDEIMRIFGGEQISKLMDMLKFDEGQPIEHSLISKSIESAQVKVEGFFFDQRKRLVDYDDVMNKQREVIYARRRSLLEAGTASADSVGDTTGLREQVLKQLDEAVSEVVSLHAPSSEDKNSYHQLTKEFCKIIPFDSGSQSRLATELEKLSDVNQIEDHLNKIAHQLYEQREKEFGSESMRQLEKAVVLQAVDSKWMDHLDAMESLREGIWLRGDQRTVLTEYKKESFVLFESLLAAIDSEVANTIFRVAITKNPQPMAIDMTQAQTSHTDTTDLAQAMQTSSGSQAPVKQVEGSLSDLAQALSGASGISKPAPGVGLGKVGRNDPCPCGSGLKYKKCGLIGAPQHRG